MMESRRWVILGAVALVAIVTIVWLASRPRGVAPPTPAAQQPQPSQAPSATRREAPKNVTVPEPGSQAAAGVAVPTLATDAAPGVEDKKFRSFNIEASGGKYQPSTIIVRVGDTVHINFKAVDATYDISFPDYGLRQQARAGETKVIEFQAVTDGEFTLRCVEACPKGRMEGTLIVAPR